jgi:hypothetical protein
VAVVVDGEEATTTTTTIRLHHTTRTTPATLNPDTAPRKVGDLASGLVLQVVLRLDGQQDSLATEGVEVIRAVDGVLGTEVEEGGIMAVRVARGHRLGIASPALGMRALGLARPPDDRALLSRLNFSHWFKNDTPIRNLPIYLYQMFEHGNK